MLSDAFIHEGSGARNTPGTSAFPTWRRPIWPLPGPSESLGVKKVKRAGTSGGGWVYNYPVRKAKTEIPRQLVHSEASSNEEPDITLRRLTRVFANPARL